MKAHPRNSKQWLRANVDVDLKETLEALAVARGTTLTEQVELALRDFLDRELGQIRQDAEAAGLSPSEYLVRQRVRTRLDAPSEFSSARM